MSTVPFPNKDDVETQAAVWIAKIDRGLSTNEEVDLNRWLELSVLHGETLVKCASMWDLLDILRPISKLFPIDEAADKAYSLKSRKIGSLAIAASLALVVGATVFLAKPYHYSSFKKEVATSLNPTESVTNSNELRYKTAIGEISNVSLSDGTTLKLNTDSEVSIHFSDEYRTVKLLQGEVFFEVAKNPIRPFVVEVGPERVTAIGTAFSVDQSHLSETEVFVTEGKVKVNRITNKPTELYNDVFLTPGQKMVIRDNLPEILHDQDMESQLAWRDGMVVFTGEPLEEVIREIDRYTPLKFKIIDQEIASIMVGGFFRTGDLDQLLLVLEQNFGVKSYRLGEEILLSRARG